MLKVREGDMSPASVIFAIHSSHWQQRTGRKGCVGFGMTSEIYLLEHVLCVGVALVTSELRKGEALPSKDL
jgi:hypothetical protein